MTWASRKATTQESVSSLLELFLQSFCPSLVISLPGSTNLSRAGCILNSGLLFFGFPVYFHCFGQELVILIIPTTKENERKVCYI